MSSNLWICCNARTGSNYLCELLNNSKEFEIWKKDKSFDEWIRWLTKEEFYQNPPPNSKMIFEQMEKKLKNVTAKDIKQIFPNIKFVLLKRNNLLEHLASLYFARFTGAYYLSHENQKEWYFNLPIKFHPILTKTLFEEIKDYQTNWNTFFDKEDYLSITYEDLISNPNITLKTILEYCGKNHNVQIKSNLVKMTRPELTKFISYAREILFEKML